MKRRILLNMALCAFVLGGSAAWAMTDEKAALLSTQFVPPAVLETFAQYPYLQETLGRPLEEIQEGVGKLHYLSFTMPGDTDQYLLLAWGGGHGYASYVYWRLLKSEDHEATFSVQQDSVEWVTPFDLWGIRAQDLTGDGVPEILFEQTRGEWESLAIFAWRNQKLINITPRSRDYSILEEEDKEFFHTAFCANNLIELQDADGDRMAEVIVHPSLDRVEIEKHNIVWRPLTPTSIYKYDGSNYVLWKEISADDPFPITVPSIALLHPGTIPFSELIRFEQDRQAGKANASGTDEGLRIFVSHPAGQATADDFETNAFVCDGQGLSFQKRWPNAKQPDTTSANWEWGGCPIRQAPCAKGEAAKGAASAAGEGACAHWNFSPEDPFMPSPDKKMEYHFVGPYLELRLPKAAVYPFVYRAALDAFTKEPTRTEYFAEVPISGKMKNGKLAAVSALVCVERTGNEKIAASAAPPAPAAKETPAQPPTTPAPATPAAAEPAKASPGTK